METRARHVLIGLFTLAAAVLAILFALWLGKSQSERDFHTYDIAFAEAVSGLSRGSTVEYNGIRVGEVTDLRLDPKNPKNVYARVRIESGAPVRTDTQATLMPVGITGTSQIRLSSGSDPAGRPLLSSSDSIPVIHATPSPMGKLLAGGEDVLYNFNQLLITARAAFSDENIQRLNKTLEHIEQTTGALAGQRGTLTRSITDFNQATLQAKMAFSEMHKLMRAGNQIASGDLIFKQATVKGFWGSKVSAALSVDDKRRLIGELLGLAASGALKLPVEAVYDLADVSQAAAASLQPGRKGKVLLRP